MSVDLQWELVRNFNCGLVKRSGCTFSTEAFNLAGKHSLKYSGFAQNKVFICRIMIAILIFFLKF